MYQDYSASPDLLTGRTIVVTGAGRDIGRAAALAYAAHGATVVLVDESVNDLETTYDLIEAAGGPQPAIYPIAADEHTPQKYRELAGILIQEFGQLSGVLVVPTFFGMMSPVEHYDPDIWMQTLQHNLTAAFMLLRVCLPLLRQSDDAAILISSAAVGRQGKAYWGAYGVAMAALEGFAQTLAAELEDNTRIRVNTIDPGAVLSGIRRKAYPGENPDTLVTPDAVMGAYLYLMGPDSAEVNAQQITAQD